MGFLQALLDFLGLTGQKVNVLVVGLDNSGKTTTIERLKPKGKQSLEVVPTVGFNVEEFQRSGLNFTVFDMSGAGRYRLLWEQYYREAQAIIFLIDSADRLRLVVAKDELHTMLNNHQMARTTPILFLANKRDLPGALQPSDIALALGLQELCERAWQIMPSNALTGEGLDLAMDWLADKLLKK